MAQHFSITNSEMKGFQKIYESLSKKAAQGIWAIAGSLRFEELSHIDYKISLNDRVFITQRVVNGNREMFELHFDTKEKRILDIFLVS